MSEKENQVGVVKCENGVEPQSQPPPVGDGHQMVQKSGTEIGAILKDSTKTKRVESDLAKNKASRGDQNGEVQGVTHVFKSDDFISLIELGRGHFAKVFRAECAKLNKQVALKCVDLNLARKHGMNRSTVLLEVEMMRKCHGSSFVVQLIGYFSDSSSVSLIIDLCPEGDLKKLLAKTKNGSMDEKLQRSKDVTRQILRGCTFLHGRARIVHSDIKPANLLVFSVKPFVIKITDFGLSIATDSPKTLHPFSDFRGGTDEYLSPELMDCQGFDCSVDIWAVGCVSYEIIMNKEPFFIKGASRDQARQKMKDYAFGTSSIDLEKYEPRCRLYFMEIFSPMSSRPLSEEVLNMGWLQESVPSVDATNLASESEQEVSQVPTSQDNISGRNLSAQGSAPSPQPPAKKRRSGLSKSDNA